MGELAGLVDQARFDPGRSSAADAGLAWAFTDEILARMPSGRAVWLAPVRHPRRALRRLALARSQPRRRHRWSGVVPPSAAVLETTPVPEIPGYAIEARIGVGATSAVYRAHHRTTGETAAIKVFTIDAAAGRGVDHQRFVWEAKVAEMVSGRPNLPVVLGSGFAANGQPYLITKLYTNGTLASRVRIGGPLDAAVVAAAGRELSLALEALHENGVLHGDVKPENVFIADDGSMVLGDLGGAWVPNGRGRTASLTPAYAAPEVWLGHAPSDGVGSLLARTHAAVRGDGHPAAPRRAAASRRDRRRLRGRHGVAPARDRPSAPVPLGRRCRHLLRRRSRRSGAGGQGRAGAPAAAVVDDPALTGRLSACCSVTISSRGWCSPSAGRCSSATSSPSCARPNGRTPRATWRGRRSPGRS